jgi:hypothetical protein
MPYNTAEGGSNGTTVLTSNSGGASGVAFDSVTAPPVDAVLAFDNTHAAHGTLAYKFQIGATSTQLFLQWLASFSATNLSYAKISFNSYWTANPAASAYQLHVASAAAAQVCGVRINTSGQLIIVSQAGTTIGTMTSAIPLNAWFRVEADVALDSTGTNVQVTVARYDNIDAGVATDSVVATGTTAVPFSRIRFGWGGSATTNSGPWWMDDLQVYIPSAANPAGPGQTWRRHFQHRQFPPAVGAAAAAADFTATGVTAAIVLTANPGAVSVSLPGATAGVTLAAQPGAVAVTINGPTATLVLAAAPGAVSVTLPGTTAHIVLASPAGLVAVTLPGATATVVLNAPVGSLGIGSNVTIAGATTGITFTARTGLVGVSLPGATGSVVLAAPAGSVDNGLVVVPVTVTGTDRSMTTVTASDTGSGVTGTDRSATAVAGSDRASATVSSVDRPTATITG